MSESAETVVEAVLTGSGYVIERPEQRLGVLGENATRLVWAVNFPTVSGLLERWNAEQEWLVRVTDDLVSVEKSWDLYLVLTCNPPPDEHEAQALEGIRRDVAYARKLVVAGLSDMSPARLQDRLAPLRELQIGSHETPPNPFDLLKAMASADRHPDALAILAAYSLNQPLFGDLA